MKILTAISLYAAVLAVLGFIVGLGVAITPLAVVDSSVATIFVCFAEVRPNCDSLAS